MTEEPPEGRAEGHTCVCVIVRMTYNGRTGLDSCPQWVENPDQPFCDGCTYDNHESQADPDEVAKKIQRMTKGREPA